MEPFGANPSRPDGVRSDRRSARAAKPTSSPTTLTASVLLSTRSRRLELLLAFMFTINVLMAATALPTLAVVLEAMAPRRAHGRRSEAE